ncbi:ORF1 [Torque teno mini virus 11]|uniref:Capsid protein n=1 Tax=Torque teno mini virus 11 TaxID=2065037 RepID=A8DMQ9_9VIRU|nr:ORF1 [Torque teno mini virus 11]ABU55893.1 ORF1 [Torque teno mini virus 11]
MPAYWRNYRNWRQRRWRRRRPRRYRRWRLRRPFRAFRRYGRTQWVRRKFKLSSIKLKQYQPRSIRRCVLKGMKCLFQGSAMRKSNNYWQYPHTIIPEKYPGGGGWGLQVISLSSLWEDYQHLSNYFSQSNAGLPLVRFKGMKLIFYQNQNTDYVVEIENCWPMVDTPLKHANSQPQRMLMSKKKIIMPSITTKRLRKGKKKIFVKPPAQMLNQWYFQKDVCNTKLAIITATACSLTGYYLPYKSESNNISLNALNTNIFKNADFQQPAATTGYSPRNNYYFYTTGNGTLNIPKKATELIYLGDSKNFVQGKLTEANTLKESGYPKENWGNPLWEHYITGSIPLYTSSLGPTNKIWKDNAKNPTTLNTIDKYLTPLHFPPITRVRYNPDKDTGEGNIVYFVDNYNRTGDNSFDPPTDVNKKIEGFPLWISLWGWADWIKKLGLLPRVDKDHILVIQSSFFDVKYPYYVFLDDSFTDSLGPYNTNKTAEDEFSWHPKFWFQQKSIETICACGPGVSRAREDESLQAKMEYKVYVNWGGCPSTLEKVYDPCSQPKWPTTSDIQQTISITNPEYDPSNYFYTWDTRRDFLTDTALKRLKKNQETDETISIKTGSKSSQAPISKSSKHSKKAQTKHRHRKKRKRHCSSSSSDSDETTSNYSSSSSNT